MNTSYVLHHLILHIYVHISYAITVQCCFHSPSICFLLMTDEVMTRLHMAVRMHEAGQQSKRRQRRKRKRRKRKRRKRKRRKRRKLSASMGQSDCGMEVPAPAAPAPAAAARPLQPPPLLHVYY